MSIELGDGDECEWCSERVTSRERKSKKFFIAAQKKVSIRVILFTAGKSMKSSVGCVCGKHAWHCQPLFSTFSSLAQTSQIHTWRAQFLCVKMKHRKMPKVRMYAVEEMLPVG